MIPFDAPCIMMCYLVASYNVWDDQPTAGGCLQGINNHTDMSVGLRASLFLKNLKAMSLWAVVFKNQAAETNLDMSSWESVETDSLLESLVDVRETAGLGSLFFSPRG